MESGASELIETHHMTPIGGGGDDHHARLVSNSIISSVQSSYTFTSVSAVSSVGGKNTLTKESPPDLPKLISKDTYHHHFQSASVIVENGLFSSRSEPNLLSTVVDPVGSETSSALQPPLHSANGTPMCIKRGPGRPRKDGAPASKCSNSLNKFKKFCSGNYVSGNVRGVRGSRKKLDCSSLPFPSSGGGSLSDLGVIDGDMGIFTEDTMGSDSSSVASSFDKLLEDFTFSELWPGKVCGFCNLSEKSMSGQGDLLRLEIPVGFDPAAVQKKVLDGTKEITDTEKPSTKELLASKRAKAIGKVKRLTSQGSLESTNDSIDEVVGYPEEIDLSLVFEQPAGHVFVHSGCARWCQNVVTGHKCSSSFENLEYELIRSLSQRCSHCGNLGAGIVCSVPDCGSVLHLPCAVASGSFQEASSLKTFCSSHLEMVVSLVGNSSLCTVCDEQTNLSSMIMCSTCGHHYHTTCMALSSDPSIRPGWQCPACKMCQACRQPGDEGKLLACEACDKAYHIFCLRPALTTLPKHSWKCKMCRVCSDCGSRTPGSGPSSRWHGNFSICDSCYQQRNKGLACPLCGKAYRHVAQKLMLQCHLCKKYVHGSCDSNAELSTYQLRKELYPDYEYICPVCKAGGSGCNAVTGGGSLRALSAASKKSDKEVVSTSESNSLLNSNFALSQDSLLFLEEDSPGGTESSIDLIWSEKARTASIVLSEPSQPMPSAAAPPPPLALPSATNAVPLVQQKKRNGAGRQKNTGKTGGKAAAKKKGKGRGSELGRKRGPKPKMRGVFGAPGVGLQRPSSDMPKGEEEPGVENRLVLCSSKDEFVLEQDVCVMCGAYGNDQEGRLIACAQCGQCYHPYCVNVKVTKVVLEKGWRCLDCTVCEGCGQRHDEGRLILCDDCDVSFHIYCMNPPLEVVPQGNWKCKWCAVCTLCGSNDPGPNSSWHKNYTLCGPCNSLQSCPVCSNEYAENELIIQCQNCDRWLHGSCDVILTEDEAERCADFGYQCVLCRPREIPPPHLLPPPPVLAKIPQKSPECSRSRSSCNHVVDGVWLSNSGMSHIKGVSLDQPRKKRKKLSNIADMEAGILEAIESVVSGAASRNHSEGEDSQTRAEDKDDSDKGKDGKKRRTLQKFGVGGFVARLRGPRFKDEEMDIETQSQTSGPPEQPLEKPKRKPSRRKTRNKLVECFPAYLQEAFFGKGLLDSQSVKEEVNGATGGEEEVDADSVNQVSHESTISLSVEEMNLLEGATTENRKDCATKVTAKKDPPPPLLVKTEPKKATKPVSNKSKSSGALQELLPLPSDLLDNDLVDTIMNEDITKVPDGIDDLAVTSGLVDDAELGIEQTVVGGNQKDELTDFLSSIDSGLPTMDSKDVEDIFKGVLTEEPPPAPPPPTSLFPMGGSQAPSHIPAIPSPVPIPTGGILMPQNLNSSVSQPTVQGSPSLSRSNSVHSVPPGLASPLNFPPPSPYHSEYSNSPAFSEPPSPWPATVEGEVETPGNYSQRSILKWEVDEALGTNATISAVLYANMNHPELKRDHPNWSERSKQISKIWRSLPTDKRAPYLQKARENRAASRMHKAQQDQEKLMPPVKSTRAETQEERHWKQLQAYRQQQAQQQQLALQEQRLQGDPKDHLLSPGKHPFPSSGIPMVHRQVSSEMSQMSPQMEQARQPLQVSTQHMPDGGPGALVSPHLQSMNNPRQSFPGQLNTGQGQSVRMRPPTLEMPPPSPSPHFSPKHGPNAQSSSPLLARSPMYSRVPYMHSPRPPLTSPSADPYGNSPLTPQADPYSHPPVTPRPDNDSTFSPNGPDTYGQQGQKLMNEQYMGSGSPNEMDTTGPLTSPRTPGGVPPAQETRQHLRDLLQRQQIKKMEQDGSPMTCDLGSPNGQRSITPWPADEWQKGSMEGGKHTSLSPISPISRMQGTQFRHPFLPQHTRMPQNSSAGNQMLQGRMPTPDACRQMGPLNPLPQSLQQIQLDPRVRLLLQEHQLQPSQAPHPEITILMPRSSANMFPHLPQQDLAPHLRMRQNQASFQVRSIGSGYDPMQQQNQRLCQMATIDSNAQVTSSMLAQQLGRPLGGGRGLQPQQTQLPIPQCSSILQMTSGSLNDRSGSDVISSEHQELPESVTAELEKLEEEQHRGDNGGGVEADSVELADLGMDDDELLGMGADFNILEYADPELNIVVGGEKTNILDDNLDLEEEKEEEKEIKRKEEEKSDKKEERGTNGAQFSSNLTPVPAASGDGSQEALAGFTSTQVPITVPKAEFPPGPPELGGAILGPPQPPPYPVPPPPYPGPGRPPSEQPLLLEDLLEQEKREQQRQGPMLLNTTAEEPLLSDFDFERLKADVLSSNNLPPSLSPPTLPGQGLLPPPTQQPMYNRHTLSTHNLPNANSLQQPIHLHQTTNEWQGDSHRKGEMHHENAVMHGMPLSGSNHVNNAPMRLQVPLIPPPPVPPEHPTTDQERQMVLQYEHWIYHQQQVLSLHLKYFDGEVAKLRKIKKSLNSKQRQLRKNGSELNENDAKELERVVKELGGIQKQLEQARKQTRQHGTIIQDYQNKKQKRSQMMLMNKPMGPGSGPLPPTTIRQNMPNNQQPMQPSPLANPNHSPLHSTPQSPMLSPAPAMSPLTLHSPMPSPMAPSPGISGFMHKLHFELLHSIIHQNPTSSWRCPTLGFPLLTGR